MAPRGAAPAPGAAHWHACDVGHSSRYVEQPAASQRPHDVCLRRAVSWRGWQCVDSRWRGCFGPKPEFTSDKNTIELSYMALDSQRKMKAGNQRSPGRWNLKPRNQNKGFNRAGLRILNRVESAARPLPDARRHTRHGLVVASARSSGISTCPTSTLPADHERRGVDVGHVLDVAHRKGRRAQMRKVMPAQPVALRAFPQDDELAVFAEIYDNKGRHSPPVLRLSARCCRTKGGSCSRRRKSARQKNSPRQRLGHRQAAAHTAMWRAFR